MKSRWDFGVEEGAALAGTLLYIERDHSFLFLPKVAAERSQLLSTVVVDEYLQIFFSVTDGKVFFIHGFYPRTLWKSGEVVPPETTVHGGITVRTAGEPPVPGIAYHLSGAKSWRWERRFDEATGVLMVGSVKQSRRKISAVVELLEGQIWLSLGESGALVCLHFKPEFVAS